MRVNVFVFRIGFGFFKYESLPFQDAVEDIIPELVVNEGFRNTIPVKSIERFCMSQSDSVILGFYLRGTLNIPEGLGFMILGTFSPIRETLFSLYLTLPTLSYLLLDSPLLLSPRTPWLR